MKRQSNKEPQYSAKLQARTRNNKNRKLIMEIEHYTIILRLNMKKVGFCALFAYYMAVCNSTNKKR